MQSSRSKINIPKIVPPEGEAELNVDKIVRIGTDIDREFKRQAALYAWVSNNYALASSNVRQLKNEMELLVAGLSAAARDSLKKAGENKPVKEQVYNWVIEQKKYQEKFGDLENAKLVEDQLQGLLRALDHKRDALVGLGANYRAEMAGELSMRRKD